MHRKSDSPLAWFKDNSDIECAPPGSSPIRTGVLCIPICAHVDFVNKKKRNFRLSRICEHCRVDRQKPNKIKFTGAKLSFCARDALISANRFGCMMRRVYDSGNRGFTIVHTAMAQNAYIHLHNSQILFRTSTDQFSAPVYAVPSQNFRTE